MIQMLCRNKVADYAKSAGCASLMRVAGTAFQFSVC